jgi:hypothetical protein
MIDFLSWLFQEKIWVLDFQLDDYCDNKLLDDGRGDSPRLSPNRLPAAPVSYDVDAVEKS